MSLDWNKTLNRYRWGKKNKVKHIEIKDNVVLRPTDYEIELEARGISRYSNPNINHIADANKMV